MSKITAEHLARSAYVYIRQSTPGQLTHNHESRRRQYGLADRARQLGWCTVEVIDDDLGRSGGGIARPGFERLLAAICESRVGAVLAIEASRLARNGRDWHTLIEFCGLVGTVIVDEDGIYDPRHPNDRLLLGMKGTMSELELSLFRQRSQEALKQKARRGALVLGVALGKRKSISIFGGDWPTRDGTCERDYIHVADLADAHVRALAKLQAGAGALVCNLGTGVGYTVKELIERARKLTGHPIPAEVVARRAGDPAQLVADGARAKELLDWTPQRSSLEQILADAWEFQRTHPRGFGET